MAILAYVRPTLTGADPAPVAAGVAGDVVPAHPNGFLQVTNGSASAITVTLATPGRSRVGVLDEPDLIVSVPAAGTRLIGPLVLELADAGGVQFTYSSVTSVTVAAIRS